MIKEHNNGNSKKLLVLLTSIIILYYSYSRSDFYNTIMKDNLLHPLIKTDEYNKQYLKMIKKYHPDKPDGNEEKFLQLEQFRKQYLFNNKMFSQTLNLLTKFSE